MELVDLLIFAGQSNMQGETEGLPAFNIPIQDAFEYRVLSNSLIPLAHPVGEDVYDGVLEAAHRGCGTLVPDFCDAYIKKTGKHVVAVHTARGSTRLAQWLPNGAQYGGMMEKIHAAVCKIKENYTIDKVYFVWLQGESDAIAGTTLEEYARMLVNFKDAIKRDLKLDKFCVIQVGYFCRLASWLEFSKNGTGQLRDEVIMNAQQFVVENDPDFIMLTDICKTISLNPEYMNPNVDGHYNNKGLSFIGQIAGTQLARYDVVR